MANPKFGVDIVANDKSKAGVVSATRNLQGLVRSTDKASSAAMSSTGKSVQRAGSGIVKTFGQIERASARVFSPGSGSIVTRLNSLGEVGSAVGSSFGQAASAGGLLETSITALGVAGAVTAGVLAGVAVGTDTLLSKWSKGVVGANLFARTMGIATKSLQEFQGAGERLGIDKGVAGGALGSLSQTLNNAAYSKDPTAIAAMAKAGITLRRNADGTADVEGMLPSIADAIQRQNSQGRRDLAQALGISTDAIPLFAQGGRALSADMKDVGARGAVSTDAENADSAEWLRRRAILSQEIDRGLMRAGGAGAKATLGLYGGLDAGGARVTQSIDNLARSAFSLDNASNLIGSAVDKFAGAVDRFVGGGGVPGRGGVASFTDRIAYAENSRDDQVSPKGARGRMQVMPGTALHPGLGVTPARDGSIAEYNRVGRDYANALLSYYGGDQTLAAAAYNWGQGRVDRLIRRIGDPRRGQISDEDFASRIPIEETRNYVRRALSAPGAAPGTPAGHGHMSLQEAAAREGLAVTVEVSDERVRVKTKKTNGRISMTQTGR